MTAPEKNVALKYGEWLWRGGLLIMVAGQLWVSSRYVSKDDFSAAMKSVGEIHDKMIVIEQTLKSGDGTERRLETLSERVQAMEREAAMREVRLQALEKRLIK